jgi:hypothetical protein
MRMAHSHRGRTSRSPPALIGKRYDANAVHCRSQNRPQITGMIAGMIECAGAGPTSVEPSNRNPAADGRCGT